MKIIKLLYLRYFLSFFICLISSFVIFFIFSLIGNLNENFSFYRIFNISFLNSLQILCYVPAFIFLISVILFTLLIKSKNEIIIIKCYIGMKKLLFFFIPLIILFALLEINKKNLSSLIENTKEIVSQSEQKPKSKIIISNDQSKKKFTIYTNVDLNNIDDAEYRSFVITNKEIQIAQFSNNLILSNNALIAENYTEYKNKNIEEIRKNKFLDVDIFELISQKSYVKYVFNQNNVKFDLKLINLVIFFIIFFYYIFLSFFSKTVINPKQSIIKPVILNLLILIYAFFIFNNSLSFFKFEFELLATMIIGMFFLNIYLNE